ncbi:CD320 antigen [Indicator indicator]|uniref:CD320 antigen n=1 Tax=Indicator indicator TaxID=1002788 RepID=UPI0023DFC26F|nr:CD320 antigen [Indicator indicator]
MAGRRRLLSFLFLLPLLFPVLVPLPVSLLPPPPANASLPGCSSGQFQCKPGTLCFLNEWRCDGHPDCEDGEDERDCSGRPDCEDGEDEWGCETATPAEPSPDDAWVTPPRSSAVLPTDSAETSGTAVLEGSVPSGTQGHFWILIVAVLLSVLVAVGSIAVWGLSKAKSRSDIFSLEKPSREQLMPDKSQTGEGFGVRSRQVPAASPLAIVDAVLGSRVPHGTIAQPVPPGQQLTAAPLSPQHFSHRCAAGGNTPMEPELPSSSP